MSAVAEPWIAEAIDLRKQGLSERAIAEAVNKSPSTVHGTLVKARLDGLLEDAPARGESPPEAAPASNGNGGGHAISAEDAARLANAAGDSSGQIVGQQDMAGGEVQPAPEAPPEEIVVRGTTPLDFFNLGGKRPNKASMKFVGGKVGLEQGTAFKKGEVVRFEGYATVVAATPRDKRDKSTGIVVECELQLLAEIDDLHLAG